MGQIIQITEFACFLCYSEGSGDASLLSLLAFLGEEIKCKCLHEYAIKDKENPG